MASYNILGTVGSDDIGLRVNAADVATVSTVRSSICSSDGIVTEDVYDKIVKKMDDIAEKSTAFSDGTKNIVDFVGGKVKVTYKKSPNGVIVMPDIADVRTIESNGNVKVVIVSFADGTSEKAILNADDTYSLEYGISICVTKRLLSGKCDGHGNSVYNKIVRRGLKVYKDAQKIAAKDAEQTERVKAKMEKLAQKKAAKRAKRESAEREYLVGIQTEAYIRAMRELNASANVAK